jgi:hypothetical protein
MPLPKFPGDKGKKPIEVQSTDSSQSTSAQSKVQPVKIDYEGRREKFILEICTLSFSSFMFMTILIFWILETWFSG